ncbi:MAG: AMP-binding protein, partial [Bacteroidota bacterium]
MIYLLPHTVLEAAQRTPDKEAFKCGQDSLSYGELGSQIQQLASVLWRLGVRRGDRVGVYLNRSIETAIAVHGIMYAGAAYVPLDPKAPAARTRFQLQ